MVMGLFSAIKNFAASGYDATEDRGRRRPVQRTTYAEDDHADPRKRQILSATTRDLARNFSIAAWAIRKHLDYVSDFTFQSKTGDPGFDKLLEDWMWRAMRASQFDVARRHGFGRAVRLAEACRVKDGDVFWLKVAPAGPSFFRGKIQAIEGDRIYLPHGELPENSLAGQWINGVRVDESGAAAAYAISKRNKGRLELERIVGSRSILHHACYDRYDQVRGVSPIAAGLNWFRDTYEGFEYALAKVKVGQLFGMQVFREGSDSLFGPGSATPDGDSGYEVDFGRGPFMLDLDPGDRAEVLESKTPSGETVDFLKLMVHVALKSLDIPYSFFDESFTNFYGSRGGLIQYIKSCRSKIVDLQEFCDNWAAWRIGLAIEDGEITLPSGKDFRWLNWEFVPAGVPWWDPVKEVTGNRLAVASGFTSPQRVCREVGTDLETNIREIADARRIAHEAGIELDFGSVVAETLPVEKEEEA